MTKTALPRYRTDIRLVVDISASSPEEAEKRLEAVQRFIEARVERSTFQRLPGMPKVDLVDCISDIEGL